MGNHHDKKAQDALDFHRLPVPGKLAIQPTKPLLNQSDLALAYSPGVAVPCLEIQKDPEKAYDYTSKGNMVAVISNGTAVLGLGNLGALASKPVMEGKAVLFKRFADIDSIDLEVDTSDPDEFIACVRHLGPSFGGINLEDIKAPECFVIERRLKELMDIPVFHDDQHGTAIITLAGLINAAYLTGRDFDALKIVVSGAGAAAIACIELMKAMGVPHDSVCLCDTRGVVYEGRREGMNEWKAAHAIATDARTLADAMRGADVFLGLSVKGAVTPEMVASMADRPIVFAMANPDPEITPEEVRKIRPDAIVATGRSDYPNQVNNVMGFPYVFRGALDVRATDINDAMKIAAAEALAALARAHVPEEVAKAYGGHAMVFGPQYIIPVPFDPRLIYTIPVAVAKAAMESGVARKPILSFSAYAAELSSRLNPTANTMNLLFHRIVKHPRRMIFSEGEEESIIRAAVFWRDSGYGTPILVGREDRIHARMKAMGIERLDGMVIENASLQPERLEAYIDFLYRRLQRSGFLYRDCARLVTRDRHVFASLLLAHDQGDALVGGLTRNYSRTLDRVRYVINQESGAVLCGMSVLVAQGRTIFIADTTVHEYPTAEQLAMIARQAAAKLRHLGYVPRVAFLSYYSFGRPSVSASMVRGQQESDVTARALALLDQQGCDFEYEGELAADVALNRELLALYPFSRLTEPANVLIMPGLRSANIASKLLQELGGGMSIGPILLGLEQPVQILEMGATVSEILNIAAFAAVRSIDEDGLDA